MFELFPRTPRYPLDEAFKRFSDPTEVAWLEEHKADRYSGDPAAAQNWVRRHAALEKAFAEKVRRGDLLPNGFEAPLSISSTRQSISADLWEVLVVDFESCRASVGALDLVRIEVHEGVLYHAMRRSGRSAAKEESSSAPPKPPEVSLSDDLGVLTIGSDCMYLKGEIQQDIIRQLVEAYREGKHLKSSVVLASSGSNADMIPKAFTGSPNWPKLRRHLKLENGFCWLKPAPVSTAEEDAAE